MIRRLRPWHVVALLVVVAVLRVTATLRVFSATADEATHVGAALELFQVHRYQLQRVNPPLARVVLGIAPQLGGMKFDPAGDYLWQLHSVFYGTGKYERNLFLSRLGNNVFLLLGALAIFFYVRRETDDWTAVLAVFLFTFEPVILGHSGLATNDAAATATLGVAMLAFTSWLRRPTLGRAALLGAAWAVALLCKFSNIAFVPMACLVIGVARLIADRENRRKIVRGAATLLVIAVVTPLCVWAGYAFTFGPLSELNEVRSAYGKRGEQFIVDHQTMRIPAPDFFFGVGHIRLIDKEGHLSYFRGEASRNGWLLYFPATILLKTTLALLLLLAIGWWFTRGAPRLRRLMIESAAVALVLLAFSTTSRLDLGIRYILPIFVPLTMAAAAAGSAMLRDGRAPKIAAIVLLAWHGLASIAAHPDYFPYFNFLAGRDPSRIMIDSNLDWGQDALRLRSAVRREHIDRIGLALMGTPDPDALGFPPHYGLGPFQPVSGWFAVGEHILRIDQATMGGWKWLGHAKYQLIGKSIRLYHLGAQPDLMATILVPLAGTSEDVQFPLGPRWRIRQTVTNRGPRPAHIEINACVTPGCAIDLAPGQSTPIRLPYARPPYLLMRTSPAVGDQISSETFVERTDPAAPRGFSMPVPQVRDRDFIDGTVVIHDAPVSGDFRLNLRAWALRSPYARFNVQIRNGGAVVAQRTFPSGAEGFFTKGDLMLEFPELHGQKFTADIAVNLESDDHRVWACVTATEQRTNLPRLLLPAP
jgi:4-amino-4-deoxy-L-arabinose transferase-like glycosyltransferase